MLYAFLFFFFSTSLFANLAVTENEPSSLVDGVVSAVTGDFYAHEEDIVIQGYEPLRIKRSYISAKGEGHWSFLPQAVATRFALMLFIKEPNGSEMIYRIEKKTTGHKKKKKVSWQFSPLDLDQDGKGLGTMAIGGAGLAYKFGQKASTLFRLPVNSTTTISLPTYTKSNLQLGQQMHKAYKQGVPGLKEYRLPSGRRIDFVDSTNGIIYELKPYNPRAIKLGAKQLKLYKTEIKTVPEFKNTDWETILETY